MFSSCGVIAFLQEKFSQYLAFEVISSVPDSEVYINGIYVGQTPYSHYGRKVNVKTIKAKKDGYKTQRQRAREFSPTAFFDYYTSPLLNPLKEFAGYTRQIFFILNSNNYLVLVPLIYA